MLYIKIMNDQPELPDTSAYKGFEIISVKDSDRISFSEDALANNSLRYRCSINVWSGDDVKSFPLTGTAYVMNDSGKTIARYEAKIAPRMQQVGSMLDTVAVELNARSQAMNVKRNDLDE